MEKLLVFGPARTSTHLLVSDLDLDASQTGGKLIVIHKRRNPKTNHSVDVLSSFLITFVVGSCLSLIIRCGSAASCFNT